ncbi:hypothetical protein [Schlesneria paludicola]|uniref:hypothetical protein n=1 Tax=Schlesneria paludicola TaxID=360056 RepID=UPI00029AFE3B|nr:hypothetical protein [Schlesneria paludicola]
MSLIAANQVDKGPVLASSTEPSSVPLGLVASERVSEFSFHQLRPFPHPIWHPLRSAYWLFELAFGVLSLFALLAFLAAIPLVNFIALGYLLEAQGQVARTGKFRYAMPLLALAPKLGGIAAGCWFWWWMIRQVADAASDARLIAPDTHMAAAWQIGLGVFSAAVALHLLLAIARGGRLGLFFWPPPLNALWLWKRLQQGGYARQSAQATREFIAALRIRHHFSLGLRGFFLALAWLFIPTVLFAALRDTSKPGQLLMTLIGGGMLIVVLAWVPFLQAHFAAQGRWRAMFELRTVRECYRKAPVAMVLATIVLYALSLPLYLFKVAVLPRDVYWLFTPVFIASIYPAKILIGWCYAQAMRAENRASWLIRVPMWMLQTSLLGVYVLALFLTPAIGAAGRAVLFQHHGILLPWPF